MRGEVAAAISRAACVPASAGLKRHNINFSEAMDNQQRKTLAMLSEHRAGPASTSAFPYGGSEPGSPSHGGGGARIVEGMHHRRDALSDGHLAFGNIDDLSKRFTLGMGMSVGMHYVVSDRTSMPGSRVSLPLGLRTRPLPPRLFFPSFHCIFCQAVPSQVSPTRPRLCRSHCFLRPCCRAYAPPPPTFGSHWYPFHAFFKCRKERWCNQDLIFIEFPGTRESNYVLVSGQKPEGVLTRARYVIVTHNMNVTVTEILQSLRAQRVQRGRRLSAENRGATRIGDLHAAHSLGTQGIKPPHLLGGSPTSDCSDATTGSNSCAAAAARGPHLTPHVEEDAAAGTRESDSSSSSSYASTRRPLTPDPLPSHGVTCPSHLRTTHPVPSTSDSMEGQAAAVASARGGVASHSPTAAFPGGSDDNGAFLGTDGGGAGGHGGTGAGAAHLRATQVSSESLSPDMLLCVATLTGGCRLVSTCRNGRGAAAGSITGAACLALKIDLPPLPLGIARVLHLTRLPGSQVAPGVVGFLRLRSQRVHAVDFARVGCHVRCWVPACHLCHTYKHHSCIQHDVKPYRARCTIVRVVLVLLLCCWARLARQLLVLRRSPRHHTQAACVRIGRGCARAPSRAFARDSANADT